MICLRFRHFMLLFLFGFNILLGQASHLNLIGTSMANFLKIGIGGKATAMGDAFVALSDDITALYWNPAGLGMLRNNSFVFESTNWLLGTKLYFLGCGIHIKPYGSFGVSITSFSSGEIEETTIWEPEGTGRKFDTANLAVGLTYSRRVTDRFSTGLTLKYVSERLDRESSRTVAIDIGSIFITDFLNNLRIGFTLANLGGSLKLDGTDLSVQHIEYPSVKYVRAQLGTEPWDIPLLFRFGVATDVIKTAFYKFTISTEVLDTRDFMPRIATGAEMAFKETFSIRSGYKFYEDESGLSLGFGLNLKQISGMKLVFDFAYTDFGLLSNVQRYSAIILF